VSFDWQLAVDAEALRFLLAARGRDRAMVLDGLDCLVERPDQAFDFTERSPNRRDYRVKVMGRFVITYWLEPERIVRVVRISRVKRR
jgi:mRNA-degrading endonuclease RelE of RelBE toxin-antitoxin system